MLAGAIRRSTRVRPCTAGSKLVLGHVATARVEQAVGGVQRRSRCVPRAGRGRRATSRGTSWRPLRLPMTRTSTVFGTAMLVTPPRPAGGMPEPAAGCRGPAGFNLAWAGALSAASRRLSSVASRCLPQWPAITAPSTRPRRLRRTFSGLPSNSSVRVASTALPGREDDHACTGVGLADRHRDPGGVGADLELSRRPRPAPTGRRRCHLAGQLAQPPPTRSSADHHRRAPRMLRNVTSRSRSA